jgi:hypothetical protein
MSEIKERTLPRIFIIMMKVLFALGTGFSQLPSAGPSSSGVLGVPAIGVTLMITG